MDESEQRYGHGLERTMAFSDGVFAIAITLLVLPLTDAEIDGDHVARSLLTLLPTLLAFALSFAVIGRYWILHHFTLDRLARADGTLLVLNLVYLAFIVVLPFPTSVLGEHGPGTTSVLLYAVNLIAIGITSLALWWYASRNPRLLQPSVTAVEARVRLARTAAPTVGMLPAVPLAFVSPRWAALSWLLVMPASWIGDRLYPEPEPTVTDASLSE
jgi:uncharacterized membrane protein